MKIKRFLAACMALTLSLGALTGCGNSSSNTSAESGEVQGSADAALSWVRRPWVWAG